MDDRFISNSFVQVSLERVNRACLDSAAIDLAPIPTSKLLTNNRIVENYEEKIMSTVLPAYKIFVCSGESGSGKTTAILSTFPDAIRIEGFESITVYYKFTYSHLFSDELVTLKKQDLAVKDRNEVSMNVMLAIWKIAVDKVKINDIL